MKSHPFPIVVFASHEIRKIFGTQVEDIAGLALRALLKHRRSLEVAHQQLRFRAHHIAFSSRVGTEGDLILEVAMGDPRHADKIILEGDFRSASTRANPPRPQRGRGA